MLDLLMVHFVGFHGKSDVGYESPKPLDTNHSSRLQRFSVQRIGYETTMRTITFPFSLMFSSNAHAQVMNKSHFRHYSSYVRAVNTGDINPIIVPSILED